MDEARALEGLGHLQAGVLELIAAARAFLDVVEDVVRDPATGAAVVSAVSAVARAVGDLGGPAASPAGRSTERIPVGRGAAAAAPPGTGSPRDARPPAGDDGERPDTAAIRPDSRAGSTGRTAAAAGPDSGAAGSTGRTAAVDATGRTAAADATPPGPRRRSRAQGVQRIQVS